jgi:triosephosphate isomerase (TIM)
MKKGQKFLLFNWKAYLDVKQSVDLARHIAKKYPNPLESLTLAPMNLAISEVSQALGDDIELCTQNFEIEEGAHTGSAPIGYLKALGCKYALIGHSEVRYKEAGEDTEFIGRKVLACIEADLVPILCFGERLDEKLVNETEEVIHDQVTSGISLIAGRKDARLFLAYEPIWAISSSKQQGKIELKDIEKIYKLVDMIIRHSGFKGEVKFIYGGSVGPKNIQEYLKEDYIDGVLVGAASNSKEKVDELMATFKE